MAEKERHDGIPQTYNINFGLRSKTDPRNDWESPASMKDVSLPVAEIIGWLKGRMHLPFLKRGYTFEIIVS